MSDETATVALPTGIGMTNTMISALAAEAPSPLPDIELSALTEFPSCSGLTLT